MEPHTQMSIESLYSINHSHQDKKWWFNSWGYYWWIMDPTRDLQKMARKNYVDSSLAQLAVVPVGITCSVVEGL